MTREEIDAQINTFHRAANILRQHAGDESDKLYRDRVIDHFNREIAELVRKRDNPAPPWTRQPPQPCPLKEQPAKCFRRDGDKAVIDAGLQGPLCAGCETRVTTLEGLTP